MMAPLLNRLREKGLDLCLEDGTLQVAYPGTPTEEQRQFIRAREQQLVIELLEEDNRRLHYAHQDMYRELALTRYNLRTEQINRQAADREVTRLQRELDTAQTLLTLSDCQRRALEIACDPLRDHQQQVAVPEDIRRILVLLTHPDRHDNSPAATKATAWLNGLARGRS